MTEYGKKTVAELTEILKSRGLPHTGKKAELVARLTDNDKQAESKSEEPPLAEAEPEGEPLIASAEAANAAPEQAPETATLVPTEGAAEQSAAPTETASYALHLPTSDVDSELAKRKARAERFGTGTATTTSGADAAAESTPQADTTSESLRALERAKRFGTANSSSAPTAISKLDEALPAEGPRGRGSKRKAETTDTLDDPGLKRNSASSRGARGGRGGRFAHRQRGGPGGGGGGGRGAHAGVTQAPPYTSEKDRAAAEARKKKFGA